jgi:hypothetical protein
MEAVNLYDFATNTPYDVVLCAGVLYHLRFPFLGLKKLAEATRPGGTLILETGIWSTLLPAELLYCPAPEDSPYDPTSVSFYNHAGLIAALRSMGFDDVVCRNVMVGAGLSYRGWEEFAASPHATDGTAIKIVRAIYTATRATHMNEHLSRYWFGTHTLSSRGADMREFLDQFNWQGRRRE